MQVDWTTNTNYYQYDDTISLTEALSSNTLNNTKAMYVLGSNSRSVYLCLSNGSSNINGGLVRNDSTFELMVIMILVKVSSKRMMVTFGNICIIFLMVMNLLIRILCCAEKLYGYYEHYCYGNFALKNSIVREGELATVIVTNRGSGYKDFTDVEFNTFTSGSTEHYKQDF